MSVGKLTLGELEQAIHQALASWGELAGNDENILDSLFVTQGGSGETKQGPSDQASPYERRQATNQLLMGLLEALADKDETEARVIRARFVEGLIIRDVANRLYASTDQVNRWQRAAIRDMAQILYSREMALREDRLRRLEASLPAPPYTQLFGLDELRFQGIDLLGRPDDVWVLTIVGIGGIGKTSLADAIARELIAQLQFERVLWLRAGGQAMSGQPLSAETLHDQISLMMVEELFPNRPPLSPEERKWQLRQKFTNQPHLVVIDNLETEENTAVILEAIRAFVEPTKFVLTSRSRPTVSAPTYFLSVEELGIADAAALLRHQAETIGLVELAQPDDDMIGTIYEVTGGNPLALKMVVSLAAVLPLSAVLADLSQVRPGPIEDLYRNIYWEAWRSLSDDARSLLQAMPLVSESGALPEQMTVISGLPEDSFWPAVTELVSRSLLEVRGTVQERRYGIHRLTETFLRTEIIHWD